MQRYFFDVGNSSHVQYDFTGRWLNKPDDVREMAELIALDVACFDFDTGAKVEVQVRDSAGSQLFSIPVLTAELVAA